MSDDRITRDAFLYLDPTPPVGDFAQCGTCMMFTGDHCTIHGPDVPIAAGMSCGFYIHGDPETDAETMASVTPAESGLVERQVRCEHCRFFTRGARECALYDWLNHTRPELFTLDTTVDPHGCCNAQTPPDAGPVRRFGRLADGEQER